jgi:hypothetical protein
MQMKYILQTKRSKGELAIYLTLRSSNILKYEINGRMRILMQKRLIVPPNGNKEYKISQLWIGNMTR